MDEPQSPAPDVVIRPATLADLDAVVRVRVDAILGLAPERMPTEEATKWAYKPERPELCRASIAAGHIWVAGVVEVVVVGWIEIADDFVEGLYVAPASGRRGIGAKLLLAGETQIGACGFDAARLNASAASQPFYEKHGYVPTGPRNPGRGTPMRKSLV